MKIAMVGAGYIGLVTGTCFAESGNDVICIDVDRHKIENLKKNVLPIYEPELQELVERNQRAGRLIFSTDLGQAIQDRQIIYIGVGTPQLESGAADLQAVWAVVDTVRDKAAESKIVVVKSTVPVGTNKKIAERLNQSDVEHRVASNPEFLKEGYAVDDFMKPDRVVVGTHDPEVASILLELHQPFLRTGHPFLVMSPESAEMTKYVSNCCLATKISFINEMANICEKLGADIGEVRQGMGHDERIGFHFYHPGIGYGGSCFPKDVCAMIALSDEVGMPSQILSAVDRINNAQKQVLMTKLLNLFGGDIAGKTIAIWGLAFKPRTDDIREAPSLVLIRQLLDAGATIRAFDPEAMQNVRNIFGEQITYCNGAYDALDGVDALAIVTEWQEFRNPNFETMKQLMRQPIIVDGRNLYDPSHMKRLGFSYASVGRQTASVQSDKPRAGGDLDTRNG